ncbi:MAG: hypothetical protein A07HR60_02672, partial [uncultured archaeon A07HR60]
DYAARPAARTRYRDTRERSTPEAVTDDQVEQAVAALRDAGSIEFAREKAETLTTRSKEHLSILPDNDARDLLEDLADYLITRGY